MNFSELVGTVILLRMERVDQKSEILKVKLVGTDPGGIWVESQEITNTVLQTIGAVSGEKTPVLFFPYHRISFAMATRDGFALDEKAFGL